MGQFVERRRAPRHFLDGTVRRIFQYMCAYCQTRGDENQPPYFCVCPTQFYFHLMEVIVINVAITASSWKLKQFAFNLLAKLHTIFIYYEEWDNSL